VEGDRQALARTGIRILIGVAVALLVANFAIYFSYALAMPVDPDFEAGRVIRVQLGGQLWVYVDECEARVHEIVSIWLFFVALACGLGAAFLQRSLEDRGE
jgi:hypothetical protein